MFNNGKEKDSLYRAINDSIQQLQNLQDSGYKKERAKVIELLVSRSSNRLNELSKESFENPKNFDYYFALKNYNAHYSTNFFIKNGTYNVAYVKYDSTKKTAAGPSYKYGHLEHKQIQVRYGNVDKSILVPITKKNIILYTISFLFQVS